jgi:hypothetical protein
MSRWFQANPRGRIVSGLIASLLVIVLAGIPFAAPNRQASAATRTLYVDQSGSDSTGTGTQAKPWRTIGKAVSQVVAGDLVLIGAGTYAESITIEEKHGAATNPIIFRADGNVVIDGTASSRDAVFVTYSSYVVIEGWTVQNAPRAGLRIDASHHVTVRNSTFANNGRWGLFTDFSDDLVIEHNHAYGSQLEHGIYHSNSGDRPVIRGNVIHGNYAAGLHMNADASMGGDGIISGALVEGNVIYDNGTGGGAAINMDGITDSIIRNNLLYNNRASGIAVYQIDGAVCSRNNQYLNNTIVMPNNGRWAVTVMGANCTGNKFFNNILYNAHSFRGAITTAAWPIAGFESDYNVVIGRFSNNDGNSTMTLAQWQALGNDAHSKVSTPSELFVAPGSDFHLKSGSPAIDAGRSLANVSIDLDGNPRPRGNAYDVGAYESGGSGPNPTATNTATASRTPSPTPSRTPSPTPSNTPLPSATATFTSTPLPTSTNTSTSVQSPTPTNTALPSPTATNTPTRTPTKTATNAPTATKTPSPTKTATKTPSPTATPSPTKTPTASPRCSVDPTKVRVGSKFTVSCRGFLEGESVSLFWNSTGGSALASGVAGSGGVIALSAQAPETVGGRHKAIAQGERSGKRVSLTVTVEARIVLSPKSGAGGSQVGVTLTGFRKGEVVSLRFYTGSRYVTVRQSVTAGANGSAGFTFTVPGGATASSHKVEARGNAGSRPATTYEVTVVAAASADDDPPATPPPPSPTAVPPTSTPVPPTATAQPPESTPTSSDA